MAANKKEGPGQTRWIETQPVISAPVWMWQLFFVFALDGLQWKREMPCKCELFRCQDAGCSTVTEQELVYVWKINTSTLATNKALQTSSRSKGIFLFVTDNYSICLLRETVNCSTLWISKNMVRALCCWQKELLLCILLRCRSTGKEMKGEGLWWSQQKTDSCDFFPFVEKGKLKWLDRW